MRFSVGHDPQDQDSFINFEECGKAFKRTEVFKIL